jgi:quinol monooxygenase YgiN
VIAAIWQFRVRPGREAEFERHYGPDGTWAQLFARGEGYHGTELWRDPDERGRYLLSDAWADRASYESFVTRRTAADPYGAVCSRTNPLSRAGIRFPKYNLPS